MIDRKARNRLAELVRSLASGLITNDQFEDSIPASKDPAISEVYRKGAWFLYDDLREYKLKGETALTAETRFLVARWVLFLKSDYEYEWPSASFKARFLHIASLGVLGESMRELWGRTGDVAYWPFVSEAQFLEAKRGKGYLGAEDI